jgi:predicted DNA-binding protein
MSLLIELPRELERRLTAAAARDGLPVSEYVTNALEALTKASKESDESDAVAALQARYAAAGISWNGKELQPRTPRVQAPEGVSLSQLLIEDRR